MGRTKSTESIENDNLFKALICLLPALGFTLMAKQLWLSPGLVLLDVLFTLVAMYFVLSVLVHAAWYTNDCDREKAHNN
tara:strand:+ start:620 stop:856 length:237 start_codon:yes stop_codon:yes gene_type:complete